MKKQIQLFCLIVLSLCIDNTIKSQTAQLSKVEGKEQGFVGELGESFYIVSKNNNGKKNTVFINKCNTNSMEVEISKEIKFDGTDFDKNKWEVVKLDRQIIFIINIVGKKNEPSKLYAQIIVDKSGEIDVANNLKFITEWGYKSKDGKYVDPISDIKIVTSTSDNLPNSMILVYNETVKMNYLGSNDRTCFVLIDKDLKLFDVQNMYFEKPYPAHVSPVMDNYGNVYYMSNLTYLSNLDKKSAWNITIYNVKDRKIISKPFPLELFKNGETPNSINSYLLNAKGDLRIAGFYNKKLEDRYPNVEGIYIVETAVDGKFKLNYSTVAFSLNGYASENKKIADFMLRVALDLTSNNMILTKSINGFNKRSEWLGFEIDLYDVYSIDDNLNFKKINSFTSKLPYLSVSGLENYYPAKFSDGKNCIYMIFDTRKEFAESLHRNDLSYWICAVNTFHFNGTIEQKYLYNVEDNYSSLMFNNKLKNGDIMVWANFKTMRPVKISFK